MEDVHDNVSQSSAVASNINQDIETVNTASAEISRSSDLVKTSASDLQQLALKLKNIVHSSTI